jgi:hypothetical protein
VYYVIPRADIGLFNDALRREALDMRGRSRISHLVQLKEECTTVFFNGALFVAGIEM